MQVSGMNTKKQLYNAASRKKIAERKKLAKEEDAKKKAAEAKGDCSKP